MNFDDIKYNIDVFVVLRKLKIEFEYVEGQDNVVTNCPLKEHEDNHPSFMIAVQGEKQGLWMCYGCNSRGHIIHLVQRVLDVTREEAETKLREWFGLSEVVLYPTLSELKDLLCHEDRHYQIEDMVRIPLPKLSEGEVECVIPYLINNRGYDFEQAQAVKDFFKIGFADTGYYQGRIIVPIYDSTGQLAMFEANSSVKKPKKLYPRGSPKSKILFNNNNVEGKFVWLVEGVWDVIKLWHFCEPVVASMGATVSADQMRLLISKYSEVTVLFDGDEAGREGARKVCMALSPFLKVKSFDLRFGDPGELNRRDFEEIKRFLL